MKSNLGYHTTRPNETPPPSGESPAPTETPESGLSNSTLPPTPTETTEIGPNEADPGRSPTPPTAPPDIDAMLGRLHHTAAWGIGSTVAYIGIYLGVGEAVAGITGLGAYFVTQGHLLREVERRCRGPLLDKDNNLHLPYEYGRGAASVFYPTAVMAVLGLSAPQTYASPTVFGLFAATVVFWGLHTLRHRGGDTPQV